ncbi:MAG: metallophosphoesterase [Bacteroidaceae bacterium]|nr:metallophosphoesterase [Bacteroidaceae bacterium]
MKNKGRVRKLVLVFMLSSMCLTVVGQNQPGMPWQVRVMSYNVQHCAGLDTTVDYDRTAGVIFGQQPDAVALQELDSMTTRSGMCNQMAELASRTLFFPTFARSIDYDGGKYGVGILTRERPLSVTRTPLPGKEPRVLLVVELKNYVMACTHLDLAEENRLASVPIIVAEAQKWQKPFLIAGDWNDEPDSKLMNELRQHFVINTGKKATYPADKPKVCIDYIASYKGQPAVTLNHQVIDEPKASDHRPLIANLRLPLKAEQLMTVKPYLQDPQPTRMTVMFQTTAPAHCWVEYGTDRNDLTRKRALLDGQEVCFDIENRITLDNLQPGQQYYYRVCVVDLLMKHAYEFHTGDTLRTQFYQFQTPKVDGTDFTCVIFNDLHEHQGTYDFLRDTLRATGIHPDFVIFNGDCLPEPYDREHAMRMIHSLADPINGAEIPIFFIRGNHEIRNYYSAGMHRLIGYPNDKTYGGISWGDTRFMVLDCGEDKPDDHREYAGFNDFTQLRAEETAFIKRELKSKEFRSAKRKILISHIPVFGNDDKYQPCSETWGPLLKSQPFDAAIFAHTHKFLYSPNGLEGAAYPVVNGDGPNIQRAAVTILQKQGNKLHLKTLSRTSANCIDVDL